jgi:hypothetical protein
MRWGVSDLETKLAECAEAAEKLPPGPWEAANTLSAKWPVVRMPRGHATYTPSVYLQRTANGLEASANGDRIGATNVAAFIVAARNIDWPELVRAFRAAKQQEKAAALQPSGGEEE